MATDVTVNYAYVNPTYYESGGSFSQQTIISKAGASMTWIGNDVAGAVATYAGVNTIRASYNLYFDESALYPTITGIDLGKDVDGQQFQKIWRAANDGNMLHRQEVFSNSDTAQAEDSIYRWGGSIDSPAIAPTDAVIQEVTGAVAVSGVLQTEGVQFVSEVVGTVAPGNFTTQMTWAVRDSTSAMAVAMTLHPILFTLTPAVRLSNLAGSGIRIVVADADGDLSATNDITVNSIDFGDSLSYITLDSAGNMVFSDGVVSAGEVTLSDLIGGGPGGATSLDGLTDVDIPSAGANDGDILVYGGSSGLWTPQTNSGGVSFGTSQYEIPYTNSTKNDFSYTAGFVYNSVAGYLQIPTAVDIRVSATRAVYSQTSNPYTIAIGPTSATTTFTGASNIVMGYQSGNLSAGAAYNVVIGHQSLRSSGQNHARNVAIGYRSMYTFSTVAAYSDNVAIGTSTLSNASSYYQIAIGYNAGNHSQGISNIAFGYYAGDNLEGGYNIMIGYVAGQGSGTTTNATVHNIGIGYAALTDLETGEQNIAIGRYAGYLITDGDDNICIGYQAGNLLTTGSDNILIGYDVDVDSNSDSDVFRLGKTTNYLLEGDMTTGSQWLSAPQGMRDMVNVAKAEILYTNTAQTTIVTLPANAVIWDIQVEVTTAFTGTGTDLLDIGTTASGNRYEDDLDISSTGWKTLTLSNIPDTMSGSTNITFQYFDQNSDAGAGTAYVYVHYSLHS